MVLAHYWFTLQHTQVQKGHMLRMCDSRAVSCFKYTFRIRIFLSAVYDFYYYYTRYCFIHNLFLRPPQTSSVNLRAEDSEGFFIPYCYFYEFIRTLRTSLDFDKFNSYGNKLLHWKAKTGKIGPKVKLQWLFVMIMLFWGYVDPKFQFRPFKPFAIILQRAER